MELYGKVVAIKIPQCDIEKNNNNENMTAKTELFQRNRRPKTIKCSNNNNKIQNVPCWRWQQWTSFSVESVRSMIVHQMFYFTINIGLYSYFFYYSYLLQLKHFQCYGRSMHCALYVVCSVHHQISVSTFSFEFVN